MRDPPLSLTGLSTWPTSGVALAYEQHNLIQHLIFAETEYFVTRVRAIGPWWLQLSSCG